MIQNIDITKEHPSNEGYSKPIGIILFLKMHRIDFVTLS